MSEHFLEQGYKFVDSGQYLEALAAFEKASEQEPENPQCWYGQGLALYRLERYSESIALLNQALRLREVYGLALVRRGLAYQGLEQPEVAKADFEQVIGIAAESAEDWQARGIAFDKLGRNEEAIASFDQSIALKADDHNAWINRGVALGDLGRHENAIDSFEQAIALKADDHAAWGNRGVALHNLGRYKEASASYDQAIVIKADYPEAWGNRGIALANLGRHEEAIASYDQSIALKADDHAAWGNRGNSLRNLGRYEEAIDSYDQSIALKADDHAAWGNRGNSLRNLGRYEEAIDSYDQTIALKSDDHKAWYNRGIALDNLGRNEEAIASFDQSIALKADNHEAWTGRGNSLHNLGRNEEAIASYDQAITIKPDDHEAWYNRGIVLDNLGQYEEAIASFDQSIALKADYHEAWTGRGNSLHNLGRNEEAIASYDQAITIKPDDHEAWYNRGVSLHKLGRHEDAVASYDQAIAIKLDKHEAWYNRGIVLHKLGRYEETIDSFDQAIAIKPDDHETWNNRGVSLRNLGRYEEAVASYDQALYWTQGQFVQAWLNRGLALLNWHWLEHRDYRPAIQNYDQAIGNLNPNQPDYAFGCGLLHQKKADVLYQYAAYSSNPFPDWLEAKQSYFKAQELLSLEQYPERHLLIWQNLVKVCFALGNKQAVEQVLQEGAAKLARLLHNPQLPQGNKIALERRFAGFEQLQVDALAPSDPLAAWELAEKSKNRALWRLRYGWGGQTPKLPYAQVQSFLPPGTAIVYWHLSAAALTTFILKPGCPPQLLAPTPPPRSTPPRPGQPDYPPALHQLQQLEQCLQQWKQSYQAADPETGENQPWQEQLPSLLFTRLRGILETNRLVKDCLTDVDQLILVPHRDLHLLPLHTLFPGRFTITYLPSLQLGLELQQSVLQPAELNTLLSVEDPPSAFVKKKAASSSKMLFAELESTIIAQLYETHSIIGTDATRQQVRQALQSGTGCFHFTGHAYHNLEHPLQSALALVGEDLLTLEDLFQLDLQPYHLVCLSACETGLTSSVDVTDEYVGLVSGFLKSGVSYVVSTLWTVDEIAAALFSIRFHQQLRHSDTPSPVIAFKQAQEWLKAVTWRDLAQWYEELGQWYRGRNGGRVDGTYETLQDAARHAKGQGAGEGEEQPPFKHPHYWAGFIITGNL